MIKVAILPERYGSVFSPCATIRLASFFDSIRTSEVDVEVRYLLLSELEEYRPDVVIWHRVALATVPEVHELGEIIHRLGARGIYDIDDNLLDLESHGESAAYLPKKRAVVESIRLADQVWCSTGRLAERVRQLSVQQAIVLPNALDPTIWRDAAAQKPSKVGALRILYMGTRTHDEDFALLHEAARLLEKRSPGSIELSLIGVRAGGHQLHGSWLKTVDAPSHVGASYPAFVTWFRHLRGQFDLGVAPLLSNAFNDCKSHIKVLDYASIGLPTLASAVPAYMDYLRSGVDCLHAQNIASAWSDQLESICADRSRLDGVTVEAARLVGERPFAEATSARVQLLKGVV